MGRSLMDPVGPRRGLNAGGIGWLRKLCERNRGLRGLRCHKWSQVCDGTRLTVLSGVYILL